MLAVLGSLTPHAADSIPAAGWGGQRPGSSAAVSSRRTRSVVSGGGTRSARGKALRDLSLEVSLERGGGLRDLQGQKT